MKTLFISLFAALTLLIHSSCNAQQSDQQNSYSQKARRNLATDRILLNVFESGQVDKLNPIIAPGFVNHQAAGDIHGLDSLKIGVGKFHAMMGTVKLELKRQWADDDFVSDWVRFSSPNSKTVIEGMEVTKYINGKAVEHFFFPNGQTKKN